MNSTLKKLAGVIWTQPSKRYLAYMRSPAWLQRRREHLAAYPNCQIPGCWRPAIQVHHWWYGRLGNEMPEDLASVCLNCHHRLHCMTLPTPANDNQLSFKFNEPAA